jgi:exodeoxyribonuclease V beta subunit
MRPFDCLSADCPIFGPHLLEASAGTGKTFSIEHVFVRLLLEGIEVEEILAVTFTRAATRDLKKRILANIEEALSRIQTGKKGWPYLDPHMGSEKSLKILSEASLSFDQSQVFTIHGFCYSMLQEFAFEAGLGFSLRDPDRAALVPKRIRREARKFLETEVGIICPEQMALLMEKSDSLDELVTRLLKAKSDGVDFKDLVARYSFVMEGENHDESELLRILNEVRSSYKMAVKGNFEEQIKALSKCKENPVESLRFLIKEGGSLFRFLHDDNKKVKCKAECPEALKRIAQNVLSLIEIARDVQGILGVLYKAWKKIEGPILLEEEWIDPDEILKRMRGAIEREVFAKSVQQKYQAVIIDEFQDTDPLQWEIFKKLFMNVKALYIVGDPKQSIYRFRNADIYTYFEAKKLLGPSALYALDTNYRSTSNMIEALNALFDRNWLPLPKLGEMIPSPPVKTSLEKVSDIPDALGSIHFVTASSFEDAWLPYAVSEIERLKSLLKNPTSFALLVKDRYQAAEALKLFQERCIPACARSHVPLGKTVAFQMLREFIEALIFCRESSLKRKVAAGPFGALSLKAAKMLLEEGDLVSFCRNLLECVPGELDTDLRQIVEELLAWEERVTLQGLLHFLDDFERLDPEEGGRRRIEADAEAVQILTLHVSKGLEFDVVFAFGLSAKHPKMNEQEEADAEKLRQLYVALTRAKKRLYVPLPANVTQRGSPSPMELFCQTIEAKEGPLLPFLREVKHVTCVTLPEKVMLASPVFDPKKEISAPLVRAIPNVSPCFIHSFTTLAKPEKTYIESEDAPPIFTAHTIPRGADTGILIHQIFERLFGAPIPIWKDFNAVKVLVSEHLLGTPLLPWEHPIQEMVCKTLTLPINSEAPFSLTELQMGELQVEMEFLFSRPPHFIKGYIDLVFRHRGKFYIVDWKTNWLGNDDAAYHSLEDAMTAHDYWLQASLYTEALRRHVKRFYIQPFEELFGGVIYLFLRGGGVCHIKPESMHG